jgi:hypothetical protein
MTEFSQVTPLPVWRHYLNADHQLDEDLMAWLDLGRSVSLLARGSTPAGHKAVRFAVQDLFAAADELAALGLDFRPVLPSREECTRLLESAPAITSFDADGKAFRNRYVTIDLRDKAGLVILLSCGTGTKLDANGTQPFVVRAADTYRQFNSILLF